MALASPSRPSPLLISDLPPTMGEDELSALVRPFGPLAKSPQIISRDGQSCAALIHFQQKDAVTQAFYTLQRAVVHGRKLRVNWSPDEKSGESVGDGCAMANNPVAAAAVGTAAMLNGPGRSKSIINSIYIRYESTKVDPITFQTLSPIFEQFGPVTEISIKDSTVDPRVGRQSGQAFIHYESNEEGLKSALRAVEVMNGRTVNEIAFKAEPSRNLAKQFDAAQRGSLGSKTPSASAGLFDRIHVPSAAAATARSTMSTPSPTQSAIQQSPFYEGVQPRSHKAPVGRAPPLPPFATERHYPSAAFPTNVPYQNLQNRSRSNSFDFRSNGFQKASGDHASSWRDDPSSASMSRSTSRESILQIDSLSFEGNYAMQSPRSNSEDTTSSAELDWELSFPFFLQQSTQPQQPLYHVQFPDHHLPEAQVQQPQQYYYHQQQQQQQQVPSQRNYMLPPSRLQVENERNLAYQQSINRAQQQHPSAGNNSGFPFNSNTNYNGRNGGHYGNNGHGAHAQQQRARSSPQYLR